MKSIIWKCEGCGGNPCIAIIDDRDGRPLECLFHITNSFKESSKWVEGSISDLVLQLGNKE